MHSQQVLDELRIIVTLLLASLVAFFGRGLHAGQALGDLLPTQVCDVHL